MPASLDSNRVERRNGTLDEVPRILDLPTALWTKPIKAYEAIALPEHSTRLLAADKPCSFSTDCKEPRHVTKGGIVDSMCKAHAKARNARNGANYRAKKREAKAKGGIKNHGSKRKVHSKR